MSFASEIGVVEIPSTAVATTTFPVSVDLGGLVPVFLIATAINRSGTGNGAATTKISVGFATSTTMRYSLAFAIETGVTPSNCAQSIDNATLIHEISASNVLQGKIGISDMSTPDQVTLIVSTQLVETHTIGLEIFAGTSITNATVIEFVKSAGSTGPISVTSPGFPVEFAMGMGISSNTFPLNFAGIFLTLCRALPATAKNQTLTYNVLDAVAASDSAVYCNDAEFLCQAAAAGTVSYRTAITGQLPTGFTINEIENGFAQQRRYAILCVGGTFNVEFVSFLTQTDTTTDIQPACGFTPGLADLWSHNKVESTIDTAQSTMELSMGTALFPATTATNFSIACIDPDNVNPSATASALELSDAYCNLDSAGAVEGLMRTASDPPNALGLIMSDADPSQSFVMGAVFGADAADVASVQTKRILTTSHRRGVRFTT